MCIAVHRINKIKTFSILHGIKICETKKFVKKNSAYGRPLNLSMSAVTPIPKYPKVTIFLNISFGEGGGGGSSLSPDQNPPTLP